MNCISGSILLTCLFTCTACGAPASETDTGQAPLQYGIHYTITPAPGTESVAVEMQVVQTRGQLRELSFALTDARHAGFEAEGRLLAAADRVSWSPPRDGGALRWITRVSHKRSNGGYDARLSDRWGIFRAEDIIPRARTRTLKGARSETSMTFVLPAGWSAVSEYSTLRTRIEVTNPNRRFVQPRGWIALGDLGIRRETIAGTRIGVVAPNGQDVRRMDMLALLNWVLPELHEVLPDSIPRLTIVSAGDPMWRGGLSAPASIYIHASRPLISENATSTLVHELVHVAMGITARTGFDWIVEGLAEFYSIELLQRGAAVTARRYQRALEQQADWASEATSLCGVRSSGATTALAVVTFRKLDKEIRAETAGKFSLDNVASALAEVQSPVTLGMLRDLTADMLQRPSETLTVDNLPGCQQLAAEAED